jgi:hypothetical protein
MRPKINGLTVVFKGDRWRFAKQHFKGRIARYNQFFASTVQITVDSDTLGVLNLNPAFVGKKKSKFVVTACGNANNVARSLYLNLAPQDFSLIERWGLFCEHIAQTGFYCVPRYLCTISQH